MEVLYVEARTMNEDWGISRAEIKIHFHTDFQSTKHSVWYTESGPRIT